MSTNKIKSVIWVILMDKKKQKITAGRTPESVTAGELRDATCRKLRITTDGSEAFAIWICSPLLQIQLKPSHYPTALCDMWYELLSQFSATTDTLARNDLPVIMMMRNVFYPLHREKLLVIHDPQARYYLTAEAMFNVLTGRYPLEDELAFKLAALQLKMEGKKDTSYPSGTIQSIAHELLPWDVMRRNKKQPLHIEKRIRDYMKGFSLTTPGTLDHLYLNHCWTQTCYRCGFFTGQTEMVGKKKDIPVRVGITPHNIIIWNKITNKVIQLIPSKDISKTQYRTKTLAEVDNTQVSTNLIQGKDEATKKNKVSFDVFIIRFTTMASIKNKKVNKAIPIYSKQACMMQSMFNRLRDETSLHRSNGKATTSHLPVSVQQASDIEMDDIFIQNSMNFSELTLKNGNKEIPVVTKHISNKENIRGLELEPNGTLKMTGRGKIKKSAIHQKDQKDYRV